MKVCSKITRTEIPPAVFTWIIQVTGERRVVPRPGVENFTPFFGCKLGALKFKPNKKTMKLDQGRNSQS